MEEGKKGGLPMGGGNDNEEEEPHPSASSSEIEMDIEDNELGIISDSNLRKSENSGKEIKLSRLKLGQMFQGAVRAQDWVLAENLIMLADAKTLNELLCIALDSIWFLSLQQELYAISGLIKKVIASGAYDFTQAVIRTLFLDSCVSASQSRAMILADTIKLMEQRLHERLQECYDEISKAKAGAMILNFTERALKCVDSFSPCQGYRDRADTNSAIEAQRQLAAFKNFLDLVGNHLTGKDFLNAACFFLTLFSSSSDPGWVSGTSAITIHGLLSMLVERGAVNVNQCFFEASRFGSNKLVRILLQIAQRNSLDVDVDLALSFASYHGKIAMMECLVEEGNAVAFLSPLVRAVERGCMPVVEWFVKKGCRDMELFLALTIAISSCHVEAAAYLLPHVPQYVLTALSTEIIKAAGERSGGSLDGVAFLLRSDFLGNPAATYAFADKIARSSDGAVSSELRAFLAEHWSRSAFLDGLKLGNEHFRNMMQIYKWGESPICLRDLPAPLRLVIAYLPLYRECVKAGGCLLSQRLRGQLVVAVRRLRGVELGESSQGGRLLAALEHYLPPFLL